MFVVFQKAQRECNISMSHVAGGTVGGVGMGIIVTLVATVMFFKIRQARSGASFKYSMILLNLQIISLNRINDLRMIYMYYYYYYYYLQHHQWMI